MVPSNHSRREEYDVSVSTLVAPVKIRKTVTLDSDLIEALADDNPESLSSTINAILRADQERRARALSIQQLANDLDALYGPADPLAVTAAKAVLMA